MLGDINLDWAKRGEAKYRNSKMLKKLEIELSELGWVQLVQKNTHYNNANGVIIFQITCLRKASSMLRQTWDQLDLDK